MTPKNLNTKTSKETFTSFKPNKRGDMDEKIERTNRQSN